LPGGHRVRTLTPLLMFEAVASHRERCASHGTEFHEFHTSFTPDYILLVAGWPSKTTSVWALMEPRSEDRRNVMRYAPTISRSITKRRQFRIVPGQVRQFVTDRLGDIRSLLRADVQRAKAELAKHVSTIEMIPQEAGRKGHYIAAGEWDLLGGEEKRVRVVAGKDLNLRPLGYEEARPTCQRCSPVLMRVPQLVAIRLVRLFTCKK
jgi:hypothetical protein